MATPPSLVTYTETVWTTTGTKNTAAQISWQAGDLILVIGATEGGASPAAPTCTGLSFSGVTGCAVTSGSNCWGNAWVATPAGSGGPQYVAGTGNGSNRWGWGVWVWRTHAGTGGAIGTASATSPHTLLTAQITKAGANSCVCGALFDYSAAVTTSYAWTPTIGNSRQANRNNPYYTYYVGDWGDQGNAGAASFGISGVASSGPFTKFAVEIKAIPEAHAGMPPGTGTAPAPSLSLAAAPPAPDALASGTAPAPMAQAGHPAPNAPAAATAPAVTVTTAVPTTASVDTTAVTVFYTPPEGATGSGDAGNAPAAGQAPAAGTFAEQPAPAPPAEAAGTAPAAQASILNQVTVNPGRADGTGTAPPALPAPAVPAPAAAAAGTATAAGHAAAAGPGAPDAPAGGSAPFDTTANSSSLDLIADSPVYGYGYAYGAGVSTVPSGAGNAGRADADGTAPAAVPQVTVPAPAAPGTGTTAVATAATGPSPGPAPAAGTAPAPVPAPGIPAPPATATAPAPAAGIFAEQPVPADPALASGRAYNAHRQLYDTGWLYPATAVSVTGPWANLPGAQGDTLGDPATWTSDTHGAAGTLEASGYDAQASVPNGAILGDLTVSVTHAEDTPAEVASITAQAYAGATPIGSPQALTVSADLHDDEITVTGLTFDDLADLRVRLTATRT